MNLSRKSSDLLIVLLLTVAAIIVVLSGMENIIRVIFGLLLVFILPGYSLIAAMFSHQPFPVETNFVLTVGLSVAVAATTGLLLNFTPWGLQAQSWLLALSGIALGANGIALIRRSRSPYFTPSPFRFEFEWSHLALFGAAIALVFTAIGVARNGVLTQPTTGFTQLWILPPTPDTPNVVDIGIQNREHKTVSYRLVVSAEGEVLGEWDTINLLPGEQWEVQLIAQIPVDLLADDKIEARLYRNDDPETIYRSVSVAFAPEPTDS